jgi:hypothetical protein
MILVATGDKLNFVAVKLPLGEKKEYLVWLDPILKECFCHETDSVSAAILSQLERESAMIMHVKAAHRLLAIQEFMESNLFHAATKATHNIPRLH